MSDLLCEVQSNIEAELIRSYLESLGIDSVVVGSDRPASHISASFNTPIKILVQSKDIEKAKEALKGYKP